MHVSNIGQRWVVTRPTFSLMQVGFGFERILLWWLPTSKNSHFLFGVGRYVKQLTHEQNDNVPDGEC